MASFHLDHLKNYHRRFCRPSRAPNIHIKKGQNMLEILQDCFEEQDSTGSLTSSTSKEKAKYRQSSGKKCPASHSKPVPVSSRTGEASLQASAEPSKAADGSVQANEVHHGASDELNLSVDSPVVHLDANVSGSQKAISSAGQKRVASRSPVDRQASNTGISFRTRKRLNFEDKVISSTAKTENSALQVQDNVSEEQEGTSSEITQKRDDLSSEESRPKKNFSKLYSEIVKSKSKSSSVVRHTAAVPSSPPPPSDTKLLEDEFIIDGSDRSFPSQSWVTIPRKDRHLSPIKPSLENITQLQENKKMNNSTQTNKGKSGKKCFSGGSKNKFVPEEVTLTSRRVHRFSQPPSDWWIVKSDKSSVDGNSSKENDSSVVYPNRKNPTKRNHVSKSTGKKPCPSKRQKTEMCSRVQKSLDVNGSGGTVSGHDDISSSQRKPLKNIEAHPTQKSLDISGPKRGCKYQNNVMTSPNVHLKSHTEEYTSKTQMESASNSEVSKHSVWEESGPSRPKNYEMPGSSNSEMGDEKDQKSLHIKTRSSKMVPDKELHHKLVLPSNTPNVRRSNRTRFKPLEYWRGERIDFQESSSGQPVLEIVSPASVPIKIRKQRNPGKVNKRVTKKQTLLKSHEKTKMELTLDISLGDPFQATYAKDPETREIVPLDLIRPRDTYNFFVEQHGLKVFKILDTTFFSTGKLLLGPYAEKGKQHVGQDTLIFYVNFGDLLCTLHETPYKITTGDSFYVPSGNHYNIKNLLNMESCLLFTQIKR